MIGRRIAVCVMAAGMAVACGGKKGDDSGGGTSKAVVGDADKTTGDGPPKRAALTLEKLAPVIHEIGNGGTIPNAIVIELAAPVVDRENGGGVSSQTKLEIKPEIPGSLVYSGPSQLTFTPERPFEFDTTYQVTLQKLETVDGVLDAGQKPVTHSFKTPAFKFVSATPVELDLAVRHQVKMEVRFSGPVLPNLANARMKWTIDGAAPRGIGMDPLGSPNLGGGYERLVVSLTDPSIAAGKKIELKVTDVPAYNGASSGAATASYTIRADKPVSIKTATIAEGATGAYLDVVCDDKAAPPGSRSYYLRESFYGLSQRCQLTDESLAHIHIDPPLKKPYITSGRAGFRVFGDFKRGTYKVSIDAGATTVDGGTVMAPFERTLSVSMRKPQLSFAANGRYLPRTAWNNLGIKHLNVEAVNLIVRQVPQENLVFWMGNESDTADERTSNVILKKTVQMPGDADAPTTTWLDVAALLPATTKGVLELRLVGIGAQSTSRLLLTNLSLVAKKTQTPNKPHEQTVRVWALDMDSTELQSGVEVNLVRKSGKSVAKCTTAGKDGCTLQVKSEDDPDTGVPFALIAHRGDDLTYIKYDDLRADLADSSVYGVPYQSDVAYHGTSYPDRGVYRPGDTAHVVAIIHDAKDHAPDLSVPVDIKVIDPKAKVVRKLTTKTNAAGMVAIDHALPAFADTGHWRVQFAVADKVLASQDVQVEEFVPERMKVTNAPKKAEALIGDKVAFDVSAQYLFGGNAMDSGVELTCSVEPTTFTPEENGDLTYGVEAKGKAVALGESRDQLDPKGQVSIACPDFPPGAAFTQTMQLNATAAVLEAGSGRATVKAATATLHPERYYIGMRTKAMRARPGEALHVEGMIVDWTGKPDPQTVTKLQLEFLHLEADYGYSYDDASGESRYDRWLRQAPEGKREVDVVNGKFAFDVTPGSADAGYVVRAKAGKARTDLVLEGEYPYEYYGYGEGGRSDATPRPNKPTKLALELPPEIKVGQPVTVKTRSPYGGKVLWTVETDKVLTAEWKSIDPGDATWSFTVPQYAPNVYVSAFVVKDPHLESKQSFMPDRAFGVTSTRLAPTEYTQQLAVSAPKEIRSSSSLAVALDLGPGAANAFATVAVVDEGILSLTNFKSPDPLSQLLQRRALGVETFETIGWTMLHQPAGASSRTGGGDEGEADANGPAGAAGKDRVQPVKPVALFSGVVPVGPDGKANVQFQVPVYRGQLRVMAVAATPTRVGKAETKVIVKDPLVVQTTFPRFVSQNDEIQIPVFMTNMSGGKLDVTVQLKAEDLPFPGVVRPATASSPLAFTGKDTGTIKIENGRSETVVFGAKALAAFGGGKLRVLAKATGPAGTFDVKDEVDIPFLPSGPRERVITKVKVDAGTLDLAKQAPLKGWVPTSETTKYWLTSNPYGESFDHLSYLIHYPYGCIEQVTSSTRPLLYVANLAEQVDPALAELKIEDMVLAGINRVFMMETPSGGFGYWPGATEPLEWATAYATHMLLDAKKAGYAVPDDRMAEVMRWIENRVAQYERGVRIRRDRWNHYDEQSEAYLHYVLARAGKGKKGRVLRLIQDMPKDVQGEDAEDLYMLKAALYLAGDRRYEKDLKTVDTSPILPERINSWSFYSDRRRRGMMLSTFHDLFGNDPAGELLAQRVAESLTGQPSYYYNTQELVWGVTGLGKWVSSQAAKGVADGKLVADGTTIAARSTKAKSNDRTWAVARASEYKSLTLDIPASAAGMWLVTSSEGVRTGSDYKVGGNGLGVSRAYKTREGTVVDLAAGKAQLGDLLFVEVTVENTSGTTIQNIALVDRLPAGFEIENPRLGRGVQLDWVKPEQLWATEFMNMRDDRLEAFGRLAPKESRKIVYTVRAVTSGKFTLPPVEAEAMYDSTLWARAKGGTAIVGGPWTGKTI